MNYKYLPISNERQLGRKRNLNEIKFIVIHDTGNKGVGAGAMNHYKYLQSAERHGSAHYYVDDENIIQPIGDSRVAWSVGDTWANANRTRTDVKNHNSLNIELCINSDGDYKQALINTIELTKNLMSIFNIPINNVVRHFDATGKPCPNSMMSNNWEKWVLFKSKLNDPIIYNMDLSKNSTFGDVEPNHSNWAINWEKATDLKIVDGSRPKDFATREEVIEMLFRMRGL